MSSSTTIKRLREQRAWTQQDLADAADVSVRTIQRAEEGAMSAESRRAIAAALNEPVEALTRSSFPAISPVLYYERPESIDWLVSVFGLAIRMKVPGPGGQIVHGELTFDDALIIVGTSVDSEGWHTPEQLDGTITQSLYVMVANVDEHYANAIAAGGEPISEPQNAHGQRRYRIKDVEGHLWWFVQDLD